MKKFLDENFLLQNRTAERLYFEYAQQMPIIDYHNHLPPDEMADDKRFENISKIWLQGDHYKWRAMRANGISEEYITGGASDREKFRKWSETVPYTLRNPLYHWTHLELQRYFGISELLTPESADRIFDQTSSMLQQEGFSVRGLLEKMDVRIVCTTDDPVDTLAYHRKIRSDNWKVKVFPAFRPDKAMQVDDPISFNAYLSKLEQSADSEIRTFDQYLSALRKRHDFFVENGCKVSDHGLEQIYAEEYTESELVQIFDRVRSVKQLTEQEIRTFKSAMLVHFAEWDWERGLVQQFHLGTIRNNNTRMLQQLGPDTGWDSIGDFSQARSLVKFLDRLDRQDKLARTILYNINPADNELMATMIGNFNDGSVAGKIQWGSGWWFLDQKKGITEQLDALSNMGLLSRFVGMLTDSRSFLSFPRHEYFRRILCNIFGEEIENGELPQDIPWIGKVIEDICYHNARTYFDWDTIKA